MKNLFRCMIAAAALAAGSHNATAQEAVLVVPEEGGCLSSGVSSNGIGSFSLCGDGGFVIFTFGTSLKNGNVELVGANQTFDYGAGDLFAVDAQFGWPRAVVSSAAAAYWLLGVYVMDGNITSLTNIGGGTFPFDATYKNRGIYFGHGWEWGSAATVASSAVASSLAYSYGVALALGYGRRTLRDDSGAFSREDEGLIFRSELFYRGYLNDNVAIVPRIVWTHSRGSVLEDDTLVGELGIKIKF